MSAEVLEITNEEQYEAAVDKINDLWESKEGTPEYEALQFLLHQVHEYEDVSADELAG